VNKGNRTENAAYPSYPYWYYISCNRTWRKNRPKNSSD